MKVAPRMARSRCTAHDVPPDQEWCGANLPLLRLPDIKVTVAAGPVRASLKIALEIEEVTLQVIFKHGDVPFVALASPCAMKCNPQIVEGSHLLPEVLVRFHIRQPQIFRAYRASDVHVNIVFSSRYLVQLIGAVRVTNQDIAARKTLHGNVPGKPKPDYPHKITGRSVV